MDQLIKLIWDFRGPGAAQTARHHEHHLKEYIIAEKLDIKITGHADLSDLHSTAYMVVQKPIMKQIRDALIPHRGEVYDE